MDAGFWPCCWLQILWFVAGLAASLKSCSWCSSPQLGKLCSSFVPGPELLQSNSGNASALALWRKQEISWLMFQGVVLGGSFFPKGIQLIPSLRSLFRTAGAGIKLAFKACELSCSRRLRVVEHSQMEDISIQSLTGAFPISFLSAELAFCTSSTSGRRSRALIGKGLFLEGCHLDLWTCGVPLPLAHLPLCGPTRGVDF